MSGIPYLIGTAVIVPTGTVLHWSATIGDGNDEASLSGSAALTAGTYSPTGFLEHGSKKLQESIFNALMASAFVTGKPASQADVIVEIGFPAANLLPGVGLTLAELHLGATGATGAGGNIVWADFTIDNATTNDWALLGMARIGESRLLPVPVNGEITATGRFQPRWITCLRASYDDFGDQEEFPGVFGEPMGDGSGFLYSFGKSTRYREIVLRDRPQAQCGPSYPVGIFSGFGATRNILNLQTQNTSLLRGMDATTYKRTDQLSEHQYLRVGDWSARYYQTSGDSFVCYDVWPSSVTPSAGEPIEVISEAHHLLREWLRVSLLFPYEQIELSGVPSWMAKAYMPDQRGAWRMEHRRRDNRNRLYSMTLRGFLVTKPGLATP